MVERSNRPSALSTQKVTRAERLSGYVELFNHAKEVRKQAQSWYQERTRWSVTVRGDDLLFEAAHRWFTEGVDSPPRAVEARLHTSFDPDSDRRSREMRVYYDERAERKIEIDGHQIVVKLAKPGESGTPGKSDEAKIMGSSDPTRREPETLNFHARTQEGQSAVLRVLEALTQAKVDRKPALHLLNSWGSWSRRDDLPPRTLDSVVLKAGQMERLRDDLGQFLDMESEYNRRGIPWHRGYLLSGPPGTGKTSVVRALAHHFGLDLWYAPLGDVDKDTNLLTLIAEVKPRSILLLEDVDVFHASRDRESDQRGVSMAGLLNALDGVSTPHGLISIMTSNREDVIDKALIRPGRIDRREVLGHPDAEQVKRLFSQFYDVPAPSYWPTKISTTAEYVEVFKQHMTDPAGALAEIGAR